MPKRGMQVKHASHRPIPPANHELPQHFFNLFIRESNISLTMTGGFRILSGMLRWKYPTATGTRKMD